MKWALNFLLVLTVEYIQNLPMIIGVVFGLAGMKRSLAWWKCSLFFLGGSFVSAAIISSTEWIKVLGTTRTANPPDLLNMLKMGIIFSVGCGIMVVYFFLTSRLKKPFLADVVFGVLIGAATAVAEAGYLPVSLVILHALGFAAAGGSLVALFRHSAAIAPRRKMLTWIAWITLLMTILIVLFDYVPFIRS
jgi:hypothetical protein